MKILKKIFVIIVLLIVISNYQSYSLLSIAIAGTNYIVSDNSKLIESEAEKIQNENPDFGTTFEKTVGINGFIDDPIDILSVAGTIREYHNFSWTLDKINENKFNPSYVSVWNFDDYYKKLHDAGVEVMPCIQGTSKCIVDNMTSRNQKPINSNEDSTDPNSYLYHASTMFQYAARYGSNQVESSKLLLADNQEKVSGLGYIKYYENWNEPDKTWEGDKSYFSPDELAAMCSADYDGHEKTLGDTYGIKNADPNAKLVMGGVCNSKNYTQYLNSMKVWAENNRSDKKLPFDVINFHMYTGKNCPENSELEDRCKEIVQWRNKNAIDKEVWLTEFGWDTNPNSQLGVESKDIQRDWIVRTYLIANGAGIERSTMYMIRDTGSESEKGKYATCGLTTQKGEWNKKSSWYGVYTLKNTLEGFKFKEIIRKDENIYIYKFSNQTTNEDCYVLWSPTQDGSKIDNYTLNIENRTKAELTTLKDGSENGEKSNLDIIDNTVNVNVTESPIFVKVSGNKENNITKKLYTLPSVYNMSLSGTNRGNWHDRQNLGIYMKAGASFEIRQTNLSVNKDLTLDCLNNDSQTEKTYTIPKNGEWITVTIDKDSVPLIRTIYDTEQEPLVEIRNMQGTEELTYYYYKGNEKEFFDKWNSNNHSYAVIENDRATFLVPIKDRELIVKENANNYNFKSIDEMLEYYSEFVEQFDRFLGLSYDTENPLNKNVKTKFFVKANIHGAGAAYYGGNHTAQNGDSISAYLCKGWLNIHEFGHGYEGSLANQDLYLVDVMNNILAHYYQITFLNENDGGWLGKKLNIEEDMKNARDSVSNFNEFNYQQKLYVFVNLLDKIGPEKSMAYVHSKYREYLNKGIQYNASDMYVKSFSEISEYNVIPYLNACKITPSENIQAEIYEQELPMIYYLKDLVESDDKAEQLRRELNLEGKYSLVSNADIKKYAMKGNLNINISIDDFEQIRGKKIYIKDGKNIVKEILIENKNIQVDNLPVGIYSIQMPNTKGTAYKYDYEYVVVKENNLTNKEVEYKKIETNTLASDTQIVFQGLGNSEFARITMDLENKTIRVNSYNTDPHVYFTDEYASIQIFDENENLIYEKIYIGNTKSPSDDTVKIDFGYKIKIKHREASSRLIFNSKILNESEEFKNLTNAQTTYKITKHGLQKEGTTDEEQYAIYKRKIDKYIEKLKQDIPEDKQNNKYNYFMQKNYLLSNILNLNEEDRNNYIIANKVLLNGSAPVIEDIKIIEFEIGDEIIITPTYFKAIDLEDGEILLDSNNTKVTYNIPNEGNKAITEGTYIASVTIKDMDENKESKDFQIIINKKAVGENQEPNDNDKHSEEKKPSENDKTDEGNKKEEQQINKNEQNIITEEIKQENNTKVDTTQTNKTLPKTGTKTNVLVIGVIALVGFAIYMYIKMKKIK